MPKPQLPPLTVDFVRSILDYDPLTGIFRWKSRASANKSWNTQNTGRVAGTTHYAGYVKIQIGKGCHYPAHTIAWLYVHGEWMPDSVDHRMGIRGDNRIAELRRANNSDNGCNKAIQRNNTSGFVGVNFKKNTGKWESRITRNKILMWRRFFDTVIEAHEARKAMLVQIQGEFAPTNLESRPRYRHGRDPKE